LKKLFDPLRKIWVEALPEEIVRQNVLSHMIQDLGFPPSLIMVEKGLMQLPGRNVKVPQIRRMDILCYASLDELFPLLLVECKAEEMTEKALQQAAGYNQIVKARFLAVASKGKIKTFWQEQQILKSVDFLPSYKELLQAAGSQKK
jgi:hypothetical protein